MCWICLMSLHTNSTHVSMMPDLADEGIPTDLKKLPIPREEDDAPYLDWQHSIWRWRCEVPPVLLLFQAVPIPKPKPIIYSVVMMSNPYAKPFLPTFSLTATFQPCLEVTFHLAIGVSRSPITPMAKWNLTSRQGWKVAVKLNVGRKGFASDPRWPDNILQWMGDTKGREGHESGGKGRSELSGRGVSKRKRERRSGDGRIRWEKRSNREWEVCKW